MRGNNKRTLKSEKGVDDKILKYSAIGLSILAVIVFSLFMYSQSLRSDVEDGTLSSDEIASMLDSSDDFENLENSESASSPIGKTVEELENNTTNVNTTSENQIMTVTKNTTTNTTQTTTQASTTRNENKTETETNGEVEKQESKEEMKELNFEKPVEGEITRDFSKDSLIYSETLKEWVTHLGIDIKADKTTVVKAAEAGTVKTIKNDPRYGITIVIEHENGFQTIYSNLLTSEFVVEGENVEKGQSIGTVGNTAIFEIADEPHLHFEILKDSIQVDPNLYLK